MVAKRFFYVSAGLLCLALSYHLGARSAGAQAGSMVSGFSAPAGTAHGGMGEGQVFVFTPNGDVYARYMSTVPGNAGPLHHLGNFWGGPTPAQAETWGAMKSRYRGERGVAQPTSQDK